MKCMGAHSHTRVLNVYNLHFIAKVLCATKLSINCERETEACADAPSAPLPTPKRACTRASVEDEWFSTKEKKYVSRTTTVNGAKKEKDLGLTTKIINGD